MYLVSNSLTLDASVKLSKKKCFNPSCSESVLGLISENIFTEHIARIVVNRFSKKAALNPPKVLG